MPEPARPPGGRSGDPHAMALGNIGSMLAGLSTIVIAVGALIRGPAVVRF